jgi:hypothetical protein
MFLGDEKFREFCMTTCLLQEESPISLTRPPLHPNLIHSSNPLSSSGQIGGNLKVFRAN